MRNTGGRPLLHTVLFESVDGPDKHIENTRGLITAVRGMRNIPGVREMRVASRSLTSPNVLEELVISDNDQLQKLRVDTNHDAVVDLARRHTNWKVVDRLKPNAYDEEALVIGAASKASRPVTRQSILSFHDGASENDVNEVLGQYRDITGNAEGSGLLFPAEVALSLDRRKGDIAVVRETWADFDAALRAGLSEAYILLAHDLGDVAAKTTVLNYVETAAQPR